MLNNPFNTESIYRSYLPPLILTGLLIVLGNGLIYYYYYSDVFWPRTLPYFEDFTADERVEYRQVGGSWKLEDERLIQQDASLVDILAVIPALELEVGQPYEFSTNISVLEGPKGGGIVFNMQDRGTVVESHLIRLGTNEGNDYLIYGYFEEDRNFNVQGSANPEGLPNEFKLGVKTDGVTYSVLLNDAVVAEGIELIHEGGSLALTTWRSKVAFDNVSVVGPDQPIMVEGETVVGEGEAPAQTAGGEQASGQQAETVVVQQVPAQQSETIIVQQPQTVQVAIEEPAPDDGSGVPVMPALGVLPYFEDFTDKTELDFPIVNGEWALQDGTIAQTNPQLVDVVSNVDRESHRVRYPDHLSHTQRHSRPVRGRVRLRRANDDRYV